jgi:two-component system response regulator VicR
MKKLDINPKILIVSNHQTTGPLWVFGLKQQNLDVILEPAPANAIQRWSEEVPDLIVFDINWPEKLVLELLQKLRAETTVPIILLTPSRNEDFLIETYQAGVDETLVKPINPSLFLAKIQAWLRRAWTVPADTLDPLKVGKIQLLPSDHAVILEDGNLIRLTNLEFRLLYFLMSRAGRTATAEELIQRVWGYAGEADNTVLKNLIYRVRRKIEKDPASPAFIQTLPGLGYKFSTDHNP